jgi:hypothetical protein
VLIGSRWLAALTLGLAVYLLAPAVLIGLCGWLY